MKKVFALLLFFTFSLKFVFAQTVGRDSGITYYVDGIKVRGAITFPGMGQPDRCGSYIYSLQYQLDHPELQQQVEHDSWLISHFDPSQQNTRAVTVIPVVVHVIYKSANENIPDAQILSQIEALNKDYRKLNPDVSGVPGIYEMLAADSHIEFCMAQQDPNGNPTNGIERFQTVADSFDSNDNMKHAPLGTVPWDHNKYLNIWVCHLNHGLLGFSTRPPVQWSAASDGCVVSYKAFGTTGTVASPYHLGRTTTHEVGHWLGLIHTWGDDGGSCSGSDSIADTPNQASEHYGCPAFPQISCSNQGDMSMDYMDYSNDACMYMFTLGQAGRMNAVLYQLRGSILNSNGCSAPLNVNLNELDILFSISPNPTKGILHISSGSSLNKEISCEVFDLSGKKILMQHFMFRDMSDYELDLSVNPGGIYFLKISDGKNITTRKIILESKD